MGIFDKYSELLGKKEVKKKVVEKPEIQEKPQKIQISQTTPKKEVIGKQEQKIKSSLPRILFLSKLIMMIKKDIKILIRSKTSALIVLLGPLVIILLVGLAFNSSSLYNIRIATYSESYSELTDSITKSLENQEYSVIKAKSLESCKDGVKFGDFHLCAIFPKDLKIGDKDNIIEVYVDQSRINLASLITNTISEKVSAKSTELGISLTTDMLSVLDKTKKSIEEKIIIINKLISDNSDSTLKIQGSEDNLNKIDLTGNISEINFTDIEAQVNAIRNKYNVSLVMSNNLKNSIEDVKLGVDTLKLKLDEASKSRASTIQDLESIRKLLTISLADLNSLRTALNTISAEVGSIKVTDAGLIVEPIKTSVQPITKDKSHLSFLFPTMIVLVIMFISVLLSSTIVVREKLSAAYFRNFITPTSDLLYMIGTYLTNIILVMLQLLILFLVSLYFFKNQLLSMAPNLALAILIIASVFIFIGMIIGYLFRTEETSTLASISINSIFLVFSNTILPIESLPGAFREIVKYNPFVVSEGMLKKILLFNTDITTLLNSIYILMSFIIILFIISYIARELTKRSI